MNARSALCGLLLLGLNALAAACEVPRLVAIPAAEDVGQETPGLIVAMQGYVAGIRDYVACVQADLAAAGRSDMVGRRDPNAGPVQTNRLCSSEFIYPYAFETTITPSRECALGRFFELTAEQADRIMVRRPAA